MDGKNSPQMRLLLSSTKTSAAFIIYMRKCRTSEHRIKMVSPSRRHTLRPISERIKARILLEITKWSYGFYFPVNRYVAWHMSLTDFLLYLLLASKRDIYAILLSNDVFLRSKRSVLQQWTFFFLFCIIWMSVTWVIVIFLNTVCGNDRDVSLLERRSNMLLYVIIECYNLDDAYFWI